MTDQKMLPKIPKHLADQGVRWVKVRDTLKGEWESVILLHELPGKASRNYICVDMENDLGLDFLEGSTYYTSCYRFKKEIEPKEEAQDKILFTYHIDSPIPLKTLHIEYKGRKESVGLPLVPEIMDAYMNDIPLSEKEEWLLAENYLRSLLGIKKAKKAEKKTPYTAETFPP